MSFYVHCTAVAFVSSLVTEQENLTSPNRNIILSQRCLLATSKTLFSYSLPENERDGAWYSVVPRFKFRAEDRLLWLRFLVIFFSSSIAYIRKCHTEGRQQLRARWCTCATWGFWQWIIYQIKQQRLYKSKTTSPTALVWGLIKDFN
jgi:hypothetical protein